MEHSVIEQEALCRHCGDSCRDLSIAVSDDYFCCRGCKEVFQLLHSAQLGTYYSTESFPGLKPVERDKISRFAYLDDESIRHRLLDFTDDTQSRVTFSLPQIHCSSCILLLENLFRLNSGISTTRVNFLRRELRVSFNDGKISLRELVQLLASIGYEPDLSLDSLDRRPRPSPLRSLYLKVGIAAFCFANIMLLSFPAYLNGGNEIDHWLSVAFRYAAIVLALPVLLYSARDYFTSAINGLRSRLLTIDLPLALGMVVLFTRSLFDIILDNGPGYLDSFAGLVFLLLLGRLFQHKTYDSLSFERDYRAYFPVSVTKKTNSGEIAIPVTSLKVGDRIIVRNQELIPADAILIRGPGRIDYSFVTGESSPHLVSSGAELRAGGRQIGGAIELDVIKEASQSYLTSLWNSNPFSKPERRGMVSLGDVAGKYFTLAILIISAATAIYWLPQNPSLGWQAVTSVLIVACPCAIALSVNFVLGTATRILGEHSFYLKNASVVESLAKIDMVVFDKTGTLTSTRETVLRFVGEPLSAEEKSLISSLAHQSTHPLSRRLAKELESSPRSEVSSFEEKSGDGISGVIGGRLLRLGRREWVAPTERDSDSEGNDVPLSTATYVSFDGSLRGRFAAENKFRKGIAETADALGRTFELMVLSGDNSRERESLTQILGDRANLIFDQSPHDKLARVRSLQQEGRRVLMVGDGLNDAGAIKAASVGVAVSEDAAGFVPACDGILDASELSHLHQFLLLAGRSMNIVLLSFGISILYNIVGLVFAVRGDLSPLVSAILMPLSSVTVMLFATLATRRQEKKIGM